MPEREEPVMIGLRRYVEDVRKEQRYVYSNDCATKW